MKLTEKFTLLCLCFSMLQPKVEAKEKPPQLSFVIYSYPIQKLIYKNGFYYQPTSDESPQVVSSLQGIYSVSNQDTIQCKVLIKASEAEITKSYEQPSNGILADRIRFEALRNVGNKKEKVRVYWSELGGDGEERTYLLRFDWKESDLKSKRKKQENLIKRLVALDKPSVNRIPFPSVGEQPPGEYELTIIFHSDGKTYRPGTWRKGPYHIKIRDDNPLRDYIQLRNSQTTKAKPKK